MSINCGLQGFSPKLLWRNWTNQKLTEATIYNTIHQRWWQTWWWGWRKHQKRRGAGTPALGVHQKINQHLVRTKKYSSSWCSPKDKPALCVHQKIRQHIWCSPADTTRTHQPVSPDTNGGYALRLGKFDWKDFCCIVDWRQKLKKIELSNLLRVSRVGRKSRPGLGLRVGVGWSQKIVLGIFLDVCWQESWSKPICRVSWMFRGSLIIIRPPWVQALGLLPSGRLPPRLRRPPSSSGCGFACAWWGWWWWWWWRCPSSGGLTCGWVAVANRGGGERRNKEIGGI